VRIDILWSEHRDVGRDHQLRALRNRVGMAAAALPWIGLGAGIWAACQTAQGYRNTMKGMKGAFFPLPPLDAISDELARASSHLLWIVLPVVVITGTAVVISLHLLRRNNYVRYLFLILIAALFCAALIAPGWMSGRYDAYHAQLEALNAVASVSSD